MTGRDAIGAMRHRLRIETPQEVDDGAGGRTVDWQDVATVWASIEPVRAGERVAADRIEAAVTHRVRMRRRTGLTHAMRLALGGRLFAVRAIRETDERGRYLEIDCEEIAP